MVICWQAGRRCVREEMLRCLQHQSISLKLLTETESKSPDYPHSIRFGKKRISGGYKNSLEKQVFAGDLGSVSVSIFSSSCYGVANSAASLLVHSGWVLVV